MFMKDGGVVIVEKPWEVTEQLAELGLERQRLVDAVHAGLVSREECTSDDPKIFGGMMMWGAPDAASARDPEEEGLALA